MIQRAQLEFSFDPPRGRDAEPVVVTRALARHRGCRRVLERVHYVKRFFPELDGLTLRVGLTRGAAGMAVPGGHEIWLNPSQLSNHTVAHEFVHLLQGFERGLPQGERSCDVFSLARDWTLNDVRPSYVRVPAALLTPDSAITPAGARLVHHVAADAVARRAGGLRNYIAYFESHLRELVTSRALGV